MQNKSLPIVSNVNGIVGATLGASVDDFQTTDNTIVAFLIDESSSMSGLAQATVDIFNDNIRALADGEGGDSLLGSTYIFNQGVRKLYSYKLFKNIADLTPKDYTPNGGTALYDATLQVLEEMEQYSDYLQQHGQNVRQIVFIVTDGEDMHSKNTATAVKTKIDALLKQETYTIILLGLGEQLTFKEAAQRMGIPTVLTTGNSPSEYRRAVGLVSKSISQLHTSQLSNGNNNFLQP